MKLLDLIRSDLYRYYGRADSIFLLKSIFLIPGFKYTFWMRICANIKKHKYGPYQIARIFLLHYQNKYLIDILPNTEIGPGLYIGHAMCIVVSSNARLGKNCNISQNVTIGKANRGKLKGYPIIGDNVYIGPGAKIIGSVVIGNNTAIGANCVVTKDVPDNSVVVGVPGRIISYKGSELYINNKI